MKRFIKDKIRKFINEQGIDGQQMNSATQSLCNTMSVKSYQEVLDRVTAAIGNKQQSPELWAKIAKPLGMLRQANNQINNEKHTTMDGAHTNSSNGMTGDSMVDESNTWWAAIQ
jgi:hypothetical protein